MGAFPGFLLKKSATAAAGTHQTPHSAGKLACGAMSYPNCEPRNLVVGGDGASNKYPAWSATTTYTFTTISSATVVEADDGSGDGVQQWVLHTTQPAVGAGNPFPGKAYWRKLRPVLWFGASGGVWGDVRKTSTTTGTKNVMNAWVAAGNPLRFHQYIYVPLAAESGDHYGVDAATWLNATGGWMSTDGAAITNLNKSCTTTSGSNEVGCADTSGITVGMDVKGTGIPTRSRVGAILTSPNRFTLVDTDTGASKNATVTGSPTLALTNRSAQSAETSASGTCFQVAMARTLEFKDANGDTWPSWWGKQVAGADATFAGFPIFGVATDDMVNCTAQRTAEGDFVNSNYSDTKNYWGTGHHRAGFREDSTVPAARAAIQAGMADAWRELRRGFPKARVFTNSGQSKRPTSGVWDKVPDSVLIEGCGSFYSPESQLMQVGWKQQFKMAKELCEQVGRSRRMPVNWGWKSYDDSDAPDTAANPKTQPFHKDIRFALGSTLLTDAALSFNFEDSDLGDLPVEVSRRLYIEEMEAPIGVPAAPIPNPAGDGSGIWSREYTNGLVIVRPKPDKATNSDWATDPDITFTLPFACRRLTGTLDPADDGSLLPAGSTVSLAPRSALILLKA